jgi:hypothetical protein
MFKKATQMHKKTTGSPVAEHDLRVLGESADLVTNKVTQAETTFNYPYLNF